MILPGTHSAPAGITRPGNRAPGYAAGPGRRRSRPGMHPRSPGAGEGAEAMKRYL